MHKNPYFWFIAQPIYKKLNGRHLEKLGVWAPVRRKTVPRQISINQHRMRYWLSVGATPTRGAQNLLEKYGFVPKAPRPFGSEKQYTKPVKTYKQLFYTPMGEKRIKSNRVVLHYRAKLQEEMNVIERKRRLTRESLAAGGTNLEAISAADELEGEDTDGMESDEADIFERKRKFEKLLQRFEKHRSENLLLLKGNDLRYNVYLKKLNKYARKDLGLDIAGYKDYVQNLKEFANVYDDMQIYAMDNFNPDRPHADDETVRIQASAIYNDGSVGSERVQKHRHSIMLTIAKMLRTGAGHFNDRDTAALNELKTNFKLYMTHDIVMLDYIRLVNKRFKRAQIDQQKREEMIKSFMDVSDEVLKKSGVSKKDYD